MLNNNWNKDANGELLPESNICLKYMTKDEFNSLTNETKTRLRLIIEQLDFVFEHLEGDVINEIAINSDGLIWGYGLVGENGKELLGKIKPIGYSKTTLDENIKYIEVDPTKAMKVLANYYDTQVHELNPILEVEIPILGHRFSGCLSPIDFGTSLNIRTKPKKVFPLEEYVLDGSLTNSQMLSLKDMIKSRKNILVVGGTASGKTTFCNGLLNAVAEIDPECRMIIIEDIRELQANIVDKVCMLVPPVTIKERKNGIGITAEMLLRSAMRRTPDRVVVGEIRDGDAAAVLLSAWNSGHSGGLTTIHADDIQGGLKKLEQYIEMSGKKPNPKLIAKTVHCIVSIQKTTVVAEDGRIYRKRMIEDIKMVDGYIEETGEYNLGYL